VRVLARGANAFVAELSMDSGAAVPEHADATEEYIHVLEGSGTITIDGQAHDITAGATVFMSAGAVVSYQNGDAPMRALQVFAGPEPAAKYDAWSWDAEDA
jgi:(S)-ureidoglycine aminohydrolase